MTIGTGVSAKGSDPCLPDPSDYPSPAMGWLTVAILFVLYILSLIDRNVMALMVDAIKADLHISDFQISLLQGTAFGIAYCLCAIPVGMALDRFSRRWVLFFSVILWSLAAASCGVGTSFGALLASRAAVGAGESGLSTGSYSIIGDSFPAHRVSLAMSVLIMGGVMGAGIVFLIGGPIVAAVLKGGPTVWPILGVIQPWQKVFILTAAPGLVLAFLAFLFREPPRQGHAGNRDTRLVATDFCEVRVYLRSNRTLFTAIFIGFGLTYAGMIGSQLWTPTYFGRVYGWDPAKIGIVLGITNIVAAAFMPVHGWIVDMVFRRGRQDAHLLWCLITVSIALPCGTAAYLVTDAWVAVFFYGLYMALILSTASLGAAVTQIVTPSRLRGRVSALYVLTIGLIAIAGGPSLVGFLTTEILSNDRLVGVSLIISLLCVLLPAIALFAAGQKMVPRAIDAASNGIDDRTKNLLQSISGD
ncbi:MFS transporter [Sphingopyxis macrogoltabida]|uniref:MFS transporter n=1 Tax=Sphingopyxis macrogoltabida TaxID=33050 RepID=UPI0006ECD9BC|nr:MFS transporter [Sphingopyxis macrogoltabida]ALJ16382.1 major facilitator superfamily protein [Sphingopyxis macrogoltabida]